MNYPQSINVHSPCNFPLAPCTRFQFTTTPHFCSHSENTKKKKKKTQQNPQDRSFPSGPLNKSSKNIYKQDYFKTKGVSPTVKICLISASEALSVMLPTNTVVVEVEFAWF